jgi:hypothetical protein
MRGRKPALLLAILAGSIFFATTPPASGVAIYQYTGNPYNIFATGLYSSTDFVTITIQFANPLVDGYVNADLKGMVQAYSFSDGVQTIANTTPGASLKFFNAIDTAGGTITGWNANVELTGGNFFINSVDFLYDEGCYTGSSFCDSSARGTNIGSWTLVPEPTTAFLLVTGLGGLAVAGGRSRRR